MKRPTAKLALTFIMKLKPRLVLIKASAFPLNPIFRRSNGPNEGWQQVNGAFERFKYGERDSMGKKRKQVDWSKGGLKKKTRKIGALWGEEKERGEKEKREEQRDEKKR